MAIVTSLNQRDFVSKEAVQAFETVADMQACTWLKDGMTCHTNGFHAAGDGGAAYYTVGANGTANGMDVLALQGGLVATLVVAESYVTPEQFGAYGDGTHDDTAALQACVKSGNTVELSGTYLITSVLDFDNISDFTMRGGTITRAADQTFNTIDGSGCQNVTIEGVTFDGNGNNRGMTYTWRDNIQACIILASQSSGIRIEDCHILNYNYGVFVLGMDVQSNPTSYENTSMNGVIRGCVFHNCNTCIDTYGKLTAIEHNVCYDTTGNAIQIESNLAPSDTDNPLNDPAYYTSSVAASIRGNMLIGVDGAAISVVSSNSYGTSIANNTVIDYATGIQGRSSGLIIDGNHLLYQKPQAVSASRLPWEMAPAILANSRATVINNYVWKADVGIKIAGASSIMGNLIERPRVVGITVYMRADATDEIVTITDNRIVGHILNTSGWWASRAIVLARSKHLFMQDNTVNSDAQPIYAAPDCNASVGRLLATIAQTDVIAAPSGYSGYVNDGTMTASSTQSAWTIRASYGDGTATIDKVIGSTVVENGTLLSANFIGVRSTGANQWDEQWELGGINSETGEKVSRTDQIRSKNDIPVLSNTLYCNSSQYTLGIYGYAADGSFIGLIGYISANKTFTTQSTCRFIRFYRTATTYSNDISINISGAYDGKYQPYEVEERLLGIDSYFPDGMNSVAGLYDELTPRQADRRVGVVDLGTLDWALQTTSWGNRYRAQIADAKLYGNTNKHTDYITDLPYTYQSADNVLSNNDSMCLGGTATETWFYLSQNIAADAAALKAAMSGHRIAYILQNPVTQVIDPELGLSYHVKNGGTEELISPSREQITSPNMHVTLVSAHIPL